jgi:hypothetical protein
MELDTHELAWAAGFIDGEGCFGLHVTHGRPTDIRKYCSFKLAVAQCDRRVLDRLQDVLQVGKVRGPYKQKEKNHNPFYVFQVTRFKETTSVVASLWPWLSPVKRLQVKQTLLDYHAFNDRPKLKMGPGAKISSCHPTAKHKGHGLCVACYNKAWRNRGK